MIPSGVDTRRFANIPSVARPSQGSDRTTVIGCLGVLEERKGHRFLIKAAARLKAKGLPLRYRIAGAGSLRDGLERYAVSLGLKDKIEFCGFVDDTAAFLADIDVFVMPSLFEGLGVAAVEAMAAGRPVIASRVGGLTELVLDNDTGLLVEPGNDAPLADAIELMHREPARAVVLGQRGREHVKRHFSLEQMATSNEAYYYDLLDKVN